MSNKVKQINTAKIARTELNRKAKAARHAKRMKVQAHKTYMRECFPKEVEHVLKAKAIDIHAAGPQIVNTAMRTAFEDVKVAKHVSSKWASVGYVYDAIMSKAGLIKRNGWNAVLSFRTAQALKADGIIV